MRTTLKELTGTAAWPIEVPCVYDSIEVLFPAEKCPPFCQIFAISAANDSKNIKYDFGNQTISSIAKAIVSYKRNFHYETWYFEEIEDSFCLLLSNDIL
jgi:hypothetical protein